jgi:hypothetical protein
MQRRSVQVTGPIPNGARPNPFGAAVFDVGDDGYVEEEFFFEGDAVSYEPVPGTTLTVDGKWALQPARSAPFKSRILVTRPQDPARFSGNVLVSWGNVSAGFEIAKLPRIAVERGDAWVSVSAQKFAIDGGPGNEANGLRGWDPARYGSLHHPGDDFSFDIFTQAARIVGCDRDVAFDPLGGLAVEHVIATGGSQSGFRMNTYIDGIQPLTEVFDGFFVQVSFGRAAKLDTTEAPGDLARSYLEHGVRIRDDLAVPVLSVSTESEAESLYPVRQPDTARIRTWEIAGSAHAGGPEGMADVIQLWVRDGLRAATATGADPSPPAGEEPNDISFTAVMNAAYVHLIRWVVEDLVPPSFPLIDFDDDPPRIRRDAHGNATGGIRLPDLEAPIAAHRGRNGRDGMEALSGSMRRFSAAKVRELYPTRDDYLAQWSAAVERGVRAGYILDTEADGVKQLGVEKAAALF